MTESTGKHYTKHRDRASEVEADRVMIEFGPEVMQNLARLENAVRGRPSFSSDAYLLLQRLSSGKPIGIEDALTDLLIVTREAARYVEQTNDDKAGLALTNVIGHIMGQSRDAKPITLRIEPKIKRG